jgi:hypothetical protein
LILPYACKAPALRQGCHSSRCWTEPKTRTQSQHSYYMLVTQIALFQKEHRCEQTQPFKSWHPGCQS